LILIKFSKLKHNLNHYYHALPLLSITYVQFNKPLPDLTRIKPSKTNKKPLKTIKKQKNQKLQIFNHLFFPTLIYFQNDSSRSLENSSGPPTN